MAENAVDVLHYVRIVARGWMWITLGLLLGVLASSAILLVQRPVYTATTSVNVNVISVDPFNSQRPASGLLDPQTEASIATSFVVAQATADELQGDTTAAEVRATVTARPVADATILRISSAASDPAAARRQTDVVAAQYLKYRQSQAEARRAAILKTIEISLAELDAEYDKATTATQRSQIEAEADRLRNRRSDISDIDTSGGSILDPAEANPVTVSPSPMLVLASGALAGAVAGLLLAVLVRTLARRVSSIDQVVDGLGTQNVTDLLLRTRGASMSTAAFRGVRNVRDRALVTSAQARDAPARVATLVHLAGVQSGSILLTLSTVVARRMPDAQIVLVGMAASGRAALVKAFGLEPVEGGALRSSKIPGIEIRALLESDDPAEPDPVLTREAVALVENSVRSTVLVVPHFSSEGARRAARIPSDLVIVVLERRFTTRAQLRNVRLDLAQVGAAVDGAVMLSFDRSDIGGADSPTSLRTIDESHTGLASSREHASSAAAVQHVGRERAENEPRSP